MKYSKFTNKQKGGYIVPVAIAILIVASVGLIGFSLFGNKKDVKPASNVSGNVNTSSNSNSLRASKATDDQTLDNDASVIELQLKKLDGDNADITSGINDTSVSLQ